MAEKPGQDTRTFVVFKLGDEEYGLDIGTVQSIVRFEEPTPVPRCPEFVMGVMNLRGRVIPVLDMMARLGLGRFAPTPGSRVIVAEGEAGILGLAVDGANEVRAIPIDAIQPTPDAAIGPEVVEMFEGVAERDGQLVILLDLNRAVPGSDYGRVGTDAQSEGDPDV
ncbi:MAG: chemotaxis protein CheW [Coriobacteriia bacterium]|nr:chemotaxis protein CheW [Coriobacteriia bacterium]